MSDEQIRLRYMRRLADSRDELVEALDRYGRVRGFDIDTPAVLEWIHKQEESPGDPGRLTTQAVNRRK